LDPARITARISDGGDGDVNKARGAASLAAGAALGVTLSQAALPAVADTLHPTAWGTALVTISVALLAAALERGRELMSRRRSLTDALRVWPPPPLAEADLIDLGVYPAADSGASSSPYQLRAADAKLWDTLASIENGIKSWRKATRRDRRKSTGWKVIVHGPARSGKSRAAAEAARAVLGDVPAVIPVDSDGLRGLADGSVTLGLREAVVCLWLDGLDRFVEALDCRAVRALEKLEELVVIVATIRSTEWNEMLDGTGQSTDVARALAARARVIALEPGGALVEPAAARPSPAEEAREATDTRAPRTREAGGAPAAVGALVGARSAVAVPATDNQRAADGGPLGARFASGARRAPGRNGASKRRSTWPALADPVLGVAVGLMLAIAVVTASLYSQLLEPPPLDSQINAERSRLLADAGVTGAHFVIDERLQLHGAGPPSWVIVLEDYPTHDLWSKAVGDFTHHPNVRSDELRVYDVVNARLHLGLDYRPAGHGLNAAQWQPLAGAPPADDYANDGTQQVIAGYALANHEDGSVMPFAVHWTGDKYTLVTLTARPRDVPNLSPVDRPSALQAWYKQPLTMYNAVPAFSNDRLHGFLVGALAYDSGSATRPVRLLTGYLAAAYAAENPVVLELHANQIRPDSLELAPCTPTNGYCPAPRCRQEVIVPPSVSLDHALLLAWNRIATRWESPVQIVIPAAPPLARTQQIGRRTAQAAHPRPSTRRTCLA
jgi:hypothetical protein